MLNTKFISLHNITIRIRDKFLFKNTFLQLERADNLLVVGANGSGKTTLVKAMAGLLPVAQGEIILDFLDDPLPYPSVHKNKIAYISFDAHKKIHLDNELKKDIEDFTGRFQKILNLSTGQTRKLIIEKALDKQSLQSHKKPAILILDEPFDGLDVSSRKNLKLLVEELTKKIFVILVTHKLDEVVKGIKKAVLIKGGKVEKFGSAKEILKSYLLFSDQTGSVIPDSIRDPEKFAWISGRSTQSSAGASPARNDKLVIDFQNVSVKFNDKKILDNINWQVKEGENWAILGPNGAGKSTLIKLITGENLQVFANKIKIFGKTRENIDLNQLNKKISVVSADLSLRTGNQMTVLKILGLKSFWILQKLGISDLASKKYGELSFGQKRLVLIAKALSKKPKVLILDEPCHGLDTTNRLKVLNEIELAAQTGTAIILITHHEEEIIPSIKKVMYLRNGNVEKISDLG